MPSRNVVKYYEENTFCHVYNRGVDKCLIFLDNEDYAVFAHLLARYLGEEVERDSSGRAYKRLDDVLQLVAFCLMPNHFHLLLYQLEQDAITRLMRAVVPSYVKYFNKRHNRIGGLFQGIYKARNIDSDIYLAHITRYIHLNPGRYEDWKWSSLGTYLGYNPIDWVHPELVLDEPIDSVKYLKFMRDYDDYKNQIAEVEKRLASPNED